MPETQLPSAQAVRQQILEGVLLRLARLPGADQFILRGGMLLRHWFRPVRRLADDLDLVATYPFSVEETAHRFRPLLADRTVDDGVIFDPDRFRAEGIWLKTDFPGVRLFASGEVASVEEEFSVDVTFGEPLVPTPVLADYPTQCGMTARLWMCRPETILGRKLHALKHMGILHWRPKDLNDLRLLLSRVPLNLADLPEAIVASFTSRGEAPGAVRSIFSHESWWSMKMSSARWHDFVRQAKCQDVPRNLAQVVAEVSARLAPVLEQLP